MRVWFNVSLVICCAFVLTFHSASALAVSGHGVETIKVGVYHFPPFVFVQSHKGESTSGLSIEMLEVMNQFQQDYRFEAVPTTASRRYSDFDKKRFDMLIFESKAWGWKDHPVDTSQAFLTGAEVYITQAQDNRGEGYFSDFTNKDMIGIVGYHYGFAGFNADVNYLSKHFKIALTDSHQSNIQMILNSRGDIAVVSKAYLQYYFLHHPDDRGKLLISQKHDQIYRHTVLLRKGKPKIDIKDINRLLYSLKSKGVLKKLWDKHGIEKRL